MKINHIYHGGALETLKQFPDKCIDMVMTSPPYWALRDYGSSVKAIWGGDENCKHKFNLKTRSMKNPHRAGLAKRNDCCSKNDKQQPESFNRNEGFCFKCGAWQGQLGLEPDFNLFIEHLCDIFDEIKRTLKDTGTIWVNLGDTYSGSGITSPHHKNIGLEKKKVMANAIPQKEVKPKWNKLNYPSKSLIMIPFRFATEMVNRGWILRNVIIWHKPNCIPSSVKDRFTVDFEYLFLFSKKRKYYFEQQFDSKEYPTKKVKELAEFIYNKAKTMRDGELYNSKYTTDKKTQALGVQEFIVSIRKVGREVLKTANLSKEEKSFLKDWIQNGSSYLQGRNKRCVWRITTKPFKEAHFAVYPETICETPLKAGCPEYVCKKCGKPREKIMKPTEEYSKFLGKSWHNHKNDLKMGLGQQTRGFSKRKGNVSNIKKYDHIGWTKCNCNAGFKSGIVLDPFFGSGTTGLVALKQNKNFIGIELNPEYIKIAKKRLSPYLKEDTEK